MQTKIETRVVKITPEYARQVLASLDKALTEGRFKQRSARNRAIQRYAQDMKAGKWLLTHQGIAFDEDGNLIDGQNRLWAIVRSGCTVEMMVSTGLPRNGDVTAMDVIDNGSARSLAQALQISHNYGPQAGEIAMMVRQIVHMCTVSLHQRGSNIQISTNEACFVLNDLNYAAAFERIAGIVNQRKLRFGPVMAPLCWYWSVKPRKAEAFASQYATLEGLSANSPALHLFKFFTELSQVRKLRKTEQEKRSVTAAALKAFDEGEAITRLIPSTRVAIPWLLGLNGSHYDMINKKCLSV